MTWLAILIVFLLRRGGVEVWLLQRDQWLVPYATGVSRRLSRWGMQSEWHALLVIGLPCLLLALVSLMLHGKLLGLPYLLLTVVVLIYSEGRGELRQLVDEYLDFWRVDEVLAAGHSARLFATDPQRVPPKALALLHRFAIDGLLYRSFTDWFAVVFWLALLGPWAALCYRLLHLYLALSGAQVHANRRAVASLLYYLDWLPARLLGFVFAMVGDFSACYLAWREQLEVKGRSAAIFLRFCGLAALRDGASLDYHGVSAGTRRVEAIARGAEQVRGLQVLLRRSSVIWWVAIALLGAWF